MTEGPQPDRPSGAAAGGAVLGTLIAGIAVWGGIGALLDWWLGIRVFLPVGVLVGAAAGVYLVVVKYGK